LLYGSAATDNNEVSQRDLLIAAVELLADAFQYVEYGSQFFRVVRFPVFLRSESDAGTVGTTALSESR